MKLNVFGNIFRGGSCVWATYTEPTPGKLMLSATGHRTHLEKPNVSHSLFCSGKCYRIPFGTQNVSKTWKVSTTPSEGAPALATHSCHRYGPQVRSKSDPPDQCTSLKRAVQVCINTCSNSSTGVLHIYSMATGRRGPAIS